MEWAIKYAADGFHVFPVYEPAGIGICSCGKGACRGKHPRTPNGVDDATTDINVIKGWWTKWSKASIGIATGPKSGVSVVDLDGPEGLASGLSMQLSSTVEALTGNGKQLFYSDPNGVLKNSVKTISSGLDTRGDGGYVVAPPSIHPNGKVYRWAKSPLSRHALTPLPAIFTAPRTGLLGGVRKPEGWLSDALKGMRNGNIDTTLTSILGRLRHDNWTAADAITFLHPHAKAAGATEGHLEDKVAHIWSSYQAKAAPVESQKTDSIDVFLQDQTKVEWICDKLIARKSIGFVSGLPETMKTWLLIDLAVECARGTGMWLGVFPTSPSKVLFVDQERFKGETQRRFSAVIAAKGLKPMDLASTLFLKCGTTIKLDYEASYQAFREQLLALKPEMVIVDSFATFHNSQENNRTDIQKVMDRIKALRDEIGCTFLFINHESKMVFQDIEANEKPSAFRMMGSVAIVAAAESCFTVRKLDNDTSVVHHTKSTLGQTQQSFYASIHDVATGIEIKGKR